MKELKYLIVGAGHWGLALAQVLLDNHKQVQVWSAFQKEVDQINNEHSSVYFKQKLSPELKATIDLTAAIQEHDVLLIALPIPIITKVMAPHYGKLKNKIILLASKGMSEGRAISEIFKEKCPQVPFAVLSGPSFAVEVLDRQVTAVVIASENQKVAQQLQVDFTNLYFRVYTSKDVIGVEYCGAVKNVYAIVCGMIDAQYQGSNTKNALITRALAEMQKLLNYVGGDPKTLSGLAGIGDLMLTCNSLTSRNYSYGYYYPKAPDASKGTVEGINTVNEIHAFASAHHIDMPIINSLYAIIKEGSTPKAETQKLMQRISKPE